VRTKDVFFFVFFFFFFHLPSRTSRRLWDSVLALRWDPQNRVDRDIIDHNEVAKARTKPRDRKQRRSRVSESKGRSERTKAKLKTRGRIQDRKRGIESKSENKSGSKIERDPV